MASFAVGVIPPRREWCELPFRNHMAVFGGSPLVRVSTEHPDRQPTTRDRTARTMPAAPLTPDEPARLAALRRLNVLDTPPEAGFDDLTRLAATICGTPVAVVSLVDADRQWFKSCVGLDATETPRDVAFCAHAICRPELLVVPDATADERFADNPIVTGEPHIRFYAGMPLVIPGGHAVGTLCVIDYTPRTLTPAQTDALRALARQVVAQLQLRQQVAQQAKDHETFRVLFEQSSDAHLLFDERDGIIDCNQATVAMLRLASKEEVLALHPAVLSPEYQPCGRRSLDKCLDMDATARRDGYHRFDWTHRRADGEEFPCEVTLTPVNLHGRSVLLVVWHDLTERKRAEDAVRVSEGRFRGAFDYAPIGMALVALDGRWLKVNRGVCDILGYTADELLATDFQTLTHPDDLAADLQLAEELLAGAISTYQLEKRYLHKSGAVVFALLAVSLVRDDDGRPMYYVSHVKDITGRKRAVMELRASEEQFRRVVDDSPIGIYRTTPDGRILLANPAAVRLTSAASFEDLSRRNLEQDGSHSSYSRATFKRTLEEHGEVRGLESEWVGEDGRRVFVRENARLIRNPDGSVYYEGTIEDVSEKRRTELALRESEERFQAFMRMGPLVAWVVTADGTLEYANDHFAALIGRSADGLAGTPLGEVFPPELVAEYLANNRAVLDTGRPLHTVERAVLPDGSVAHYLAYKFPLPTPAGVPMVGGIAIDATERVRAEAELKASETRFRSVVDELAEGVVLLDYQTRAVLQANRAFLDLIGYTPGEVAALTQYDFVAHDRADIDHQMAAVVRDGRHDLGFRKYRRRDGQFLDVSVNGSRLELNGRTVLSLVVRDMSAEVAHERQLLAYQQELERANARLHALATTDRLTGVANRGAFNDKLTEEYDRAVRYTHPLSVVLLDVDHFKQFNDAFGHPAGDAVLQRVAGLLQHTARGTDTVARYGGEEFALLLPDTDYAGAMVLAERLRRAVAGGGWEKRPVTVSVGVATLTPDTAAAAALVKEADQALYRSKQAGRNRVHHGSSVVPQLATARTPAGG